jgi:phosphoadenosine phosphosulfate reductase
MTRVARRMALTPSSQASLSQAPISPARELPTLRLVVPPAEEAPQTDEGKLLPTPELLEELEQASARLEVAEPEDILRWATARFAPKFTMATAFGPEGMVLIHMLAEIAPQTPIFNLDTGYQFQETLDLREEVKRRYGIEVEYKRTDTTVEQYEQQHGGPLYRTNPDQCCLDRKVKVLEKAALGMHAWASAIRRDQSPDRAKAPIVGWDKKFGLVKVSPLANWTKQKVWGLITQHNIPYNPLHDQGYTSIGCRPCTRAVMIGEDERAGRWSGFAKTECGLHSS